MTLMALIAPIITAEGIGAAVSAAGAVCVAAVAGVLTVRHRSAAAAEDLHAGDSGDPRLLAMLWRLALWMFAISGSLAMGWLLLRFPSTYVILPGGPFWRYR